MKKTKQVERNGEGGSSHMHFSEYMLNKNKTIYLFSEIDEDTTIETCMQMEYLNGTDGDKCMLDIVNDLQRRIDVELAVEDYVFQYNRECVENNTPVKKRKSVKQLRTEIVSAVDNKKVTALIKERDTTIGYLNVDHVTLKINSVGGSVIDSLAIIDSINNSMLPVATVGTGMVASAAVLVLMNGTKGMRTASKNCKFMTHCSSYGGRGTVPHMKSIGNFTDSLEETCKKMTMKLTKIKSKKYDQIHGQEGYYFDAEEALKLGIIDYIIE